MGRCFLTAILPRDPIVSSWVAKGDLGFWIGFWGSYPASIVQWVLCAVHEIVSTGHLFKQVSDYSLCGQGFCCIPSLKISRPRQLRHTFLFSVYISHSMVFQRWGVHIKGHNASGSRVGFPKHISGQLECLSLLLLKTKPLPSERREGHI